MKNLLLLTPALLLMHACTPKATPVAGSKSNEDCRLVMCTMEYRTINVRVVDAAGKPVQLDSYKTVLTGKGTTVNNGTDARSGGDGMYPVVTDNWVRDHRNSTTKMIFIGMLGNKPVVTETYEISADCCHISKASGKEEVVIR